VAQMRIRLTSALVGALCLLGAGAAQADDQCAVVLRTPDGFLALREKPTVQSKMIAKLLQGDVLVTENEHTGTWSHVLIVTPYSGDTRGWVSRWYIQEVECLPQEGWGGGPYRENVPRTIIGQWCNAWGDHRYERCDKIRGSEKPAVAKGHVQVVRITAEGARKADGQECKGIAAYEWEGGPGYTLKFKCPRGEETWRVDLKDIKSADITIEVERP
jgi:hypothetical protein